MRAETEIFMQQLRLLSAILACVLLGSLASFLSGQQPENDRASAYSPVVQGPSNEAMLTLKRIRVPQGMKVDLFAAEPLLANPVCFCTDEHGRFYVAETFRIRAGVEDLRDHMDWLDDDLASRTVEDRLALYKKHLGSAAVNYTREHERVRLLEDTKGSGKADRSTVFADAFHDMADGIGAGLLARQGKVWYACIPNLWLLSDSKGSGRADCRRVLHTGYGVHISFYGHDLHGLRFGPDGKLYFSIGDRGLNVHTGALAVSNPNSGAVLRCNPDGSELQLFATGLRNPQELAFDEYGNLFTGDNNADHGDKARLVYVVEGGDSGWRGAYQYVRDPVWLGPWNAEKLWHTPWDGQAAYIVPPVDYIAAGPAGFTYNPGATLLPERYREHFFLCDFRGAGVVSGIRSFAVKPKGASFEMVDQHECVWRVLATDVDFNVDGALYLTDWVDGWGGTGKGRIYKVYDPARVNDPAIASVKKLLGEGMAQRSLTELVGLLSHPDMRVRQEAQFALADRGDKALSVLQKVASSGHPPRARRHAIWGLGQIGRKLPEALKLILPLTRDADAEIRAQSAKVLGDGGFGPARDALVELLRDPEPRVRFFAALALGKLGSSTVSTAAVLQMLRDNADKDPFLRHAGVMTLAGMHDTESLDRAAGDSSSAVRIGVLLALRRLQSPAIARFLEDPEPRIVLEAARAIYDVPIPEGMSQLAALVQRSGLSEPLWYRVLNANFHLGGAANAVAIARFAARDDVPQELRVEAIRQLKDWAQPSGRDRLLGMWRPLPQRSASLASAALQPVLAIIFQGPDAVRREAALAAGKLGIRESGPLLTQLLADKNQDGSVRVEALTALEAIADEHLPAALTLALADAEPALRMTALRMQARLSPEAALPAVVQALDKGTRQEQQGAFAILATMKGNHADALLVRWLDRLLGSGVAPEIQLDLLEAARQHRSPAVREKLARYEGSRRKEDPLAGYRECLAGGDAMAGRKIFAGKLEAACARCHKLRGEGGDVGPELAGIGSKQTREYLLESIVDPNRQIAQGYETVVLVLKNGQTRSGIVKTESDREIRLITSEGQVVIVLKAEIDERLRGKSAMPEDLMKFLSKSELRDLVEFLAGLKEAPRK
jgi:quinoprotein glucose dehydrogenase